MPATVCPTAQEALVVFLFLPGITTEIRIEDQLVDGQLEPAEASAQGIDCKR